MVVTSVGAALKSSIDKAIRRFAVVKNTSPAITIPEKSFELNRFDQAAYNLSETGQNNIRILRGWARSREWKQSSNYRGGPEKWGIYRNGNFETRLIIKPEASMREGLHSGSNTPRFDAKLFNDPRGQSYINPFTGEVGDWKIGTHLPLEIDYIN